MKKIIFIFALIFCAALFSPNPCAQENQFADWVRVQSDDGEFSIELPSSAGYFYDKDGFSVSFDSSTYLAKEMNMFNAFQGNTFLSVETYQSSSGKSVAEIFYERERNSGESSEIKHKNFRIKQTFKRSKDLYWIRQIFYSKNHLYVLTAASRDGETPAIKHFFDSLIFNFPIDKNSVQPNVTNNKTYLFSKIPTYLLEFEMNPPASGNQDDTKSEPALPIDNTMLPIIIFSKSAASFTDAARQSGIQGVIRLRVTFAENGRITKIAVITPLEKGLLRQAVFAALRIKFIPPEKDGKPQAATKTIEYSFAIY
ncbi:MAG: energy transducer TonB [Pyrinomonadaceae bacterium]